VAGYINPNCTLQIPITGVTVTTLGTNGCLIFFAPSMFTNNPVLMLTPITGNGGGGNPTSIVQGFTSSWFAQYTFASSPPPTVNFIATQAST
jgi:hypothetical protein